MAVSFLTAAQRDRYGRYPDVVTPNDLSRCFHLSDDDRALIMGCRGHHNRLGFALQLTTVRYLGTFLDDPIAVPSSVLQSLSHQLAIHTLDGLHQVVPDVQTSSRDLVQMMAERGIALAHTTILRWVQRYVPDFEKRWNQCAACGRLLARG